MCNYCEKIFESYEELESVALKYNSQTLHGIVRDGDKYNLGIPSDDVYYAPIAKDIKFCPYCGRKLNEKI